MLKTHYFTNCQGLLTLHGEYFTKEQNKMSAAHTSSSPSSSEIWVPCWKHHGQFHNRTTVSLSAADSCLTTRSDYCLTTFFTLKGVPLFLTDWVIIGSAGWGCHWSSLGCWSRCDLYSSLTNMLTIARSYLNLLVSVKLVWLPSITVK